GTLDRVEPAGWAAAGAVGTRDTGRIGRGPGGRKAAAGICGAKGITCGELPGAATMCKPLFGGTGIVRPRAEPGGGATRPLRGDSLSPKSCRISASLTARLICKKSICRYGRKKTR